MDFPWIVTLRRSLSSDLVEGCVDLETAKDIAEQWAKQYRGEVVSVSRRRFIVWHGQPKAAPVEPSLHWEECNNT